MPKTYIHVNKKRALIWNVNWCTSYNFFSEIQNVYNEGCFQVFAKIEQI